MIHIQAKTVQAVMQSAQGLFSFVLRIMIIKHNKKINNTPS